MQEGVDSTRSRDVEDDPEEHPHAQNRLDKALVKYNEALGHNKKLRGTIDNLWRERIVFGDIYEKLENDLVTINNDMASIHNEANPAHISRDHVQAEMVPKPTRSRSSSRTSGPRE